MKKMTIGKRIALGTGFLCLIIVVISLFAVTRLRKLDAITDSIVNDSLPGVIYAANINLFHNQNQIRCRQLLTIKTAKERDAIRTEMTLTSKAAAETLKAYEATINAPEDRQLFDKVCQARDEYRALREKFLKLVESDPAAASEFIESEVMPAYKTYSAAATALQGYNEKFGQDRGAVLAKQVANDTRILEAVGIISLIGGIAGSVLIVLSISKALRGIAGHLADGATQLASASHQVAATSQILAEGASEQAASLEETSASLEEMSSMTRRNAENATSAKQLANQTRQAADVGATNMAEMSRAMNGIKTSSDNIAKIIKTIDEIAFQTNLLALNAAVEAARAGEAGAGFAVVADEVRNLAQRSATAAKETAAKIADSIQQSDQGVQINAKVAASLQEIVIKARQVDELVAEIAAASNEQNQGISQINMATNQMDSVTQRNAASAEESASASEELSSQASALTDTVGELLTLVGSTSGVSHASKAGPAANPPTKSSAPIKKASTPALIRKPGPTPNITQSAPLPQDIDIPMGKEFVNF